MAVLERGGNAFDAAVATGFTLQVVEPHLNGPGGEVPAIFYSAERDEVHVLCGQGVAPAAATIEAFHGARPRARARDRRARRVRAGRVRRVAPPAARATGRGGSRTSSSYAIGYAEHGFPLVARDPRDDRAHRGAARHLARPRATSTCPRPRWARSSATARSPRRTGGSSRRAAAARARTRSSARASSSTRASSPRRSTASSRPRAASSSGDDLAAWEATFEPRRRARVPRAHGLQDGAVGDGPGRAPAARAPPRLRPRRALRGRARPRRHRVREARVRRPRRAVRRRGGHPARHPALRRVRERAARARRRGGVRGVPAGLRPAPDVRGAEATVGSGEPSRGTVPPRRRRPVRERDLRDAERRLAPELAGDPRARLAARDARADVLARGRTAVVARARDAAADDALARPRAPPRAAVPRVGDARRRPAGAVGAARVPPPRRPRPRPPGGDRRAGVPHRSPDLVLLPARLRRALARARGAGRVADGRGSPAPRARGHAVAGVVARPRHRWSRREADGLLKAGANPRGMQGYAVGR